jgi:hypothetical protein
MGGSVDVGVCVGRGEGVAEAGGVVGNGVDVFVGTAVGDSGASVRAGEGVRVVKPVAGAV